MSLEFWKREKNFIGHIDKEYVRDPEGFTFKLLMKRLYEEIWELESALFHDDLITSSKIMRECADVSNLVDFIASKALMNYPDKYETEKG